MGPGTHDRYLVLSHRFGLRTEWEPARHHLGVAFGRFRSDDAADAPMYEIADRGRDRPRFDATFDGAAIARSDDPERVLERILWHVNTTALRTATGVLAVHAGAVTHGGRGVLLPGRTGSGKSTLVAALCGAGFGYLSDEAGVLDRDGVLYAYPRAIALKRDPAETEGLEGVRAVRAARQWLVPPDGRGGTGPCEVGAVIAPTYRAGAATEVTPLSPAEATVLLARSTVNLGALNGGGLGVLAGVARSALAHALVYGELDRAVAAVLAVMGTRS